jgi:hypothetical protein
VAIRNDFAGIYVVDFGKVPQVVDADLIEMSVICTEDKVAVGKQSRTGKSAEQRRAGSPSRAASADG